MFFLVSGETVNYYTALVRVAAIAGMVVFLAPQNAGTCSCQYIEDAGVGIEISDLVFLGRVVALEVVPTTEPTRVHQADDVLATFEVQRGWKGEMSDRITVRTPFGDVVCGFDFRIGRDYLVYANWWDGEVYVSLCSRTAPFLEAQQDMEDLGPPMFCGQTESQSAKGQ
jgi:hypothetical protein